MRTYKSRRKLFQSSELVIYLLYHVRNGQMTEGILDFQAYVSCTVHKESSVHKQKYVRNIVIIVRESDHINLTELDKKSQ